MRVLVVEDEPQIQAEVAGQLESLGYAVDRTGDGEEGLYFGLEYPIDVAVVDIGLPGITGIELIKKARAAGRDFPVLILTARGRWQDKVEGLEAGADAVLAASMFHEARTTVASVKSTLAPRAAIREVTA